jgi:hypothetical protein
MLKTFLNPNHPPLISPHSVSSKEGEVAQVNYYEEICEHLALRKDFVIYDESDKMSLLK